MTTDKSMKLKSLDFHSYSHSRNILTCLSNKYQLTRSAQSEKRRGVAVTQILFHFFSTFFNDRETFENNLIKKTLLEMFLSKHQKTGFQNTKLSSPNFVKYNWCNFYLLRIWDAQTKFLWFEPIICLQLGGCSQCWIRTGTI